MQVMLNLPILSRVSGEKALLIKLTFCPLLPAEHLLIVFSKLLMQYSCHWLHRDWRDVVLRVLE